MTLIQWFFTVWVLGVPMQVGPFVNQTQCQNMVAGYVQKYQQEHGHKPQWRWEDGTLDSYAPDCLRHEFQLEPYSRRTP